MNIIWESVGGYVHGYTTTKSGLRAHVADVQSSCGCRPLYSLYIEGDKRKACTRATLEKINQILESR